MPQASSRPIFAGDNFWRDRQIVCVVSGGVFQAPSAVGRLAQTPISCFYCAAAMNVFADYDEFHVLIASVLSGIFVANPISPPLRFYGMLVI